LTLLANVGAAVDDLVFERLLVVVDLVFLGALVLEVDFTRLEARELVVEFTFLDDDGIFGLALLLLEVDTTLGFTKLVFKVELIFDFNVEEDFVLRFVESFAFIVVEIEDLTPEFVVRVEVVFGFELIFNLELTALLLEEFILAILVELVTVFEVLVILFFDETVVLGTFILDLFGIFCLPREELLGLPLLGFVEDRIVVFLLFIIIVFPPICFVVLFIVELLLVLVLPITVDFVTSFIEIFELIFILFKSRKESGLFVAIIFIISFFY
jgi:hypothetical protein